MCVCVCVFLQRFLAAIGMARPVLIVCGGILRYFLVR